MRVLLSLTASITIAAVAFAATPGASPHRSPSRAVCARFHQARAPRPARSPTLRPQGHSSRHVWASGFSAASPGSLAAQSSLLLSSSAPTATVTSPKSVGLSRVALQRCARRRKLRVATARLTAVRASCQCDSETLGRETIVPSPPAARAAIFSKYPRRGVWIVRDHSRSPRAVQGAFTLATCLAALAGCAPAIVLNSAFARPHVVAPAEGDTSRAQDELPTVQLRYFSFSPTVSVVAWRTDDAGYGLRASVRRDGSLVRDHRFYVGTYYEPWVQSLNLAVAPPRQFKMAGVARDDLACSFGECSPFETLSVRIPDEYLRANRHSLAVRLSGSGGREMSITVGRELIDAYLTAVDSVSAALRRGN